MNDNTGLGLLLFLLIVVIIWLAVKLKKANTLNKDFNNKNAELNDLNNNLHRENTLLIADNAMFEAEQLKFQLQPHTLGNVVATLNVIAKNLYRGTESLAESLNYILYKGNTHLVKLEDEINFIEKYIELNQLLYSDNISTSIDNSEVKTTSKFYDTPCVPHLISAYLVENAYKHGDKTHSDFLKIILKLSDNEFEMRVINQFIPKTSKNNNGGLGLKNMEKRLELLLSGKYELKTTISENEYHTILKIYLQ